MLPFLRILFYFLSSSPGYLSSSVGLTTCLEANNSIYIPMLQVCHWLTISTVRLCRPLLPKTKLLILSASPAHSFTIFSSLPSTQFFQPGNVITILKTCGPLPPPPNALIVPQQILLPPNPKCLVNQALFLYLPCHSLLSSCLACPIACPLPRLHCILHKAARVIFVK